MVRLAWLGAWAHRFTLVGTAVIVALASALLCLTGSVYQTGLSHPGSAGQLVLLAESFAGTMLLVVTLVVAATVALALRQRRREFALLLAVGATRRQLRWLVGLETSLLTATAAPVGAVVGLIAAPVLASALARAQVVPHGFQLEGGPVPVMLAVVILLPITLVAARLAARETVRIPPTAAVRESNVEPRRIGRSRRITALMLVVLAFPVALTPLVVPGVAGSASAATSAFLLLGGLALTGPLLIGWIFARTGRLEHRSRSAPLRLALANSRGFTQRLTTVIVPLAVALATGTVQTGVDRAVDVATTDQLRNGIHADLVASAPDGVTPAELEAIDRTTGVDTAQLSTVVPSQVQTDTGVPSALAWEYTQLRSVPAGPATLVDPDVTSGSLAELARPDTVAISREAQLDVGRGVGGHLVIKTPGGVEHTLTVVAIYRRGLAFGDYLVGSGLVSQIVPPPAAQPDDAVFIRTGGAHDTGSVGAAAARLRRLGLTVVDKPTYVTEATTESAALQHLSATLLLSLLAFVGLAAANTVVLSMAGRGRELRLLWHTGATRRQLLSMSAIESVITSTIAWMIGSLAVLPALLGVNYGLTGAAIPRIQPGSYAVLSLTVLLLPLVCNLPTVVRASDR